MDIKVHLQEALRQLTASKLRAFLAVLGILVGTASVVAMVSIGKLAEDQILAQFRHMGINLLSVNIQPLGSNNNPLNTLRLKDATKLPTASDNIQIASPYINVFGATRYRGHHLEGAAIGITPAMFDIAKLHLLRGRLLSFLDAGDYYCLIGNKLYHTIIKKTDITNPIDTQIAVGNTIFTIVGVLKSWPTNFFFNTDFNTSVIAPIQTVQQTQANATIQSLAVRIKDTTLINQTKTAIEHYIKTRSIDQGVEIQSPKSLIDGMRKSSETMTLLLGLIGSISLIVGGIGVMNIMLVSVAERHREIGLRLAIGARQRDIHLQFLCESITLSIFGGLSGMVLGIIITYGVALYSHWQFHIYLLPPIVGALVSIFVGVFFGFYPAMKASRLDPIETLRSE